MKPRWMSATRRLVVVAVARLVRLFCSAAEVAAVSACDGLRRLTRVLDLLGLPCCFEPSGSSHNDLEDSRKLIIDRRDVGAHLSYILTRYWLWLVTFWVNVRVWYHWCKALKRGKRVADGFSRGMGREKFWRWSWFPPNVKCGGAPGTSPEFDQTASSASLSHGLLGLVGSANGSCTAGNLSTALLNTR